MHHIPNRSLKVFGTRKTRVLGWVLVLFAGATAMPARAAGQLVVDRLELVLVPSPAGRTSSTVAVTNTGGETIQATLSREDWERTEAGENRFLASGSTMTSCGSSLTFFPAALRLEPGQSQVVRIVVSGPPDNGKECWDAIHIEQAMKHAAVSGSSLTHRFRTAVKVYVVPDGLRKDAVIEAMEIGASQLSSQLRDQSEGNRQVTISLRNVGEVHLIAKGRLEFRRPDNSVTMQAPFQDMPLLPGALRRFTVAVPDELPSGDYIVLALVDFGGSEIAAGQIELKIL